MAEARPAERRRVVGVVGAVLVAMALAVAIALGGGPREVQEWPPGMLPVQVALHAVAALIFLGVPIALAPVLRRHGRALEGRYLLFTACMATYGATQLVAIAALWLPLLWLEVGLRAVAVALAAALAVVVLKAAAELLSQPSQADWRQTTADLRAELDERRHAEAQLREAVGQLEGRLAERNAAVAGANELLTRNREWLTAIIASVPEAVIGTDATGRVVLANAAAERLTGWREADARGQALDRVWRPLDATSGAPAESVVARVIASGVAQHVPPQRLALGVDTALLALEQRGVPLRGPEGELRGVLLFVRDLTAEQDAEAMRQQLQSGLASTNALLDTLFEAAPIGLGFWDLQLRFVRVNRALARINGLPVEAHLGRTLAELLPEVARAVEPLFRRVIDERQALRDVEVSARMPAAPGRDRWWRTSCYPVYVGERLIGVGAVVDEITAFKEGERERVRLLDSEREARGVAERANAMKDEFLATVSHELRNPLNSIVGWTHMLESGRLSEADTRKAVATIARNARTQVRLVEDLLDFSRIGRGRLRLDLQQVDPGPVVQAACESFRAVAATRKVELACRNEAPGVRVMADADRLQQIVSNLVSNALKFTEAGGHVEVALRHVGSALELEVSDDGRGIEPGFAPQLFEPFTQAAAAGERQYHGLGLGLSIVKSLVELHGGSIEAVSPGAGRGARFVVRLPIAAVAAAGDDGAALGPAVLRGVTVLVVDDSADARQTLQGALQEHGAEVVLADSVAAAMTALDTGHIDVLVADIGMPYEDGFTLIRQVRAHPRHRTLPALALTARGGDDVQRRVLEAGFQYHQLKPAPLSRLVQTLADLAQVRA